MASELDEERDQAVLLFALGGGTVDVSILDFGGGDRDGDIIEFLADEDEADDE